MYALEEDWSAAMLKLYVRQEMVMFAGFCIYANVGGLKPKNVGMVAVFTTLCQALWPSTVKILQTNEDACISGAASAAASFMWVFLTWIWAAFVLTLLEYKLGDSSGSEGENQPLTS